MSKVDLVHTSGLHLSYEIFAHDFVKMFRELKAASHLGMSLSEVSAVPISLMMCFIR